MVLSHHRDFRSGGAAPSLACVLCARGQASCPDAPWGRRCSDHTPTFQTEKLRYQKGEAKGCLGPRVNPGRSGGLPGWPSSALKDTRETPLACRRRSLEGINVAFLGAWNGEHCAWLIAPRKGGGRELECGVLVPYSRACSGILHTHPLTHSTAHFPSITHPPTRPPVHPCPSSPSYHLPV